MREQLALGTELEASREYSEVSTEILIKKADDYLFLFDDPTLTEAQIDDIDKILLRIEFELTERQKNREL